MNTFYRLLWDASTTDVCHLFDSAETIYDPESKIIKSVYKDGNAKMLLDLKNKYVRFEFGKLWYLFDYMTYHDFYLIDEAWDKRWQTEGIAYLNLKNDYGHRDILEWSEDILKAWNVMIDYHKNKLETEVVFVDINTLPIIAPDVLDIYNTEYDNENIYFLEKGEPRIFIGNELIDPQASEWKLIKRINDDGHLILLKGMSYPVGVPGWPDSYKTEWFPVTEEDAENHIISIKN